MVPSEAESEPCAKAAVWSAPQGIRCRKGCSAGKNLWRLLNMKKLIFCHFCPGYEHMLGEKRSFFAKTLNCELRRSAGKRELMQVSAMQLGESSGITES